MGHISRPLREPERLAELLPAEACAAGDTINLIGRTTRLELRFTGRHTGVHPPAGHQHAGRDDKDQPPVDIDIIRFNAQAEAIADHVALGRAGGGDRHPSYRRWQAEDGTTR